MPRTKSADPAYVSKVSDVLDQSLFLIVFLIGSGGIVVLKMMGYPQWIATISPLAMMVGYAVYVGLSRRFRLKADRGGDNLYYLGFLYTLTSLGYSLYLFSVSSGAIQGIISNFGVALSTTIFGLVLRVLFHQMREDTASIEQVVRDDLRKAASSLKAELDATIGDFSSSRRATAQSLGEFAEEMKSAHGTLNENAKKLLGASAEATESAEKLIARLDAIAVPPDLIENKLTPVIDALNTSITLVVKRSNAESDHVARLQESVGKIAGAAALLETVVGKVAQGSAAQFAIIQQGTERLEASISEVLNATSESVQRALGSMETQLGLIRQESEALKASLAALRDTGEAVRQAVQDGSAEQVGTLKGLAKLAEENLAAARAHREELEAEIEGSNRLLGEFQMNLASLAALVVEKLRGT